MLGTARVVILGTGVNCYAKERVCVVILGTDMCCYPRVRA